MPKNNNKYVFRGSHQVTSQNCDKTSVGQSGRVLQRDLKKIISLGKQYSTSNFAQHLLENGLSYSQMKNVKQTYTSISRGVTWTWSKNFTLIKKP